MINILNTALICGKEVKYNFCTSYRNGKNAYKGWKIKDLKYIGKGTIFRVHGGPIQESKKVRHFWTGEWETSPTILNNQNKRKPELRRAAYLFKIGM